MSRIAIPFLLSALAVAACSSDLPSRFVSGPGPELASLPEAAAAALPESAAVDFVVTARGASASGVAPLMALAIDGREVGRTEVGETLARYVFRVERADLGREAPLRVEVRYLNDAGGGASKEDRNLFVTGLAVGGREFPTHAPDVRYERIAGPVREIIPGRVSMFWGGALIFEVPQDALADTAAAGVTADRTEG